MLTTSDFRDIQRDLRSKLIHEYGVAPTLVTFKMTQYIVQQWINEIYWSRIRVNSRWC